DVPPLAADPDQMNQVLVNLVLNAADACAPGGHVLVTASVCAGPNAPAKRARGAPAAVTAAAAAPAAPHVRIAVEDDGCGIGADALPRVFDPFYTTKPRGEGTGLGLAIVEQIVAAHGASIRIDSRPGEGTSVIL